MDDIVSTQIDSLYKLYEKQLQEIEYEKNNLDQKIREHTEHFFSKFKDRHFGENEISLFSSMLRDIYLNSLDKKSRAAEKLLQDIKQFEKKYDAMGF